jgi:hypothetical protein
MAERRCEGAPIAIIMNSANGVRNWSTAKDRLAKISEELATGSRHICIESDRVFIALVRGADKSANWTIGEIGALGRSLATHTLKLGRRMRARTRKQRIRRVLRTEAKLADLDLSNEKLIIFSEQIATLLDLVFGGKVPIDDVVFEQADATACETRSPPLSVNDSPQQDDRSAATTVRPKTGNAACE